MGVGYAASPLHRISYLDTSGQGQPPAPGDDPLYDLTAKTAGVHAKVLHGPMRFRSPDIASILAWREGIGRKYQAQLGEGLDWDEASTFEQSEDVATTDDMLLRFVAAVLDQHGVPGLRALTGSGNPPRPENLHAAFAEADRRGFAGRFPQLLLGAAYWLPFRRNMIIEEPDWNGSVGRYGSAANLAKELEDVRTAIAESAPGAVAWTADRATQQDNSLAAAWQVSDTASRLCAAALQRRVPFWTTG